MRPHSVEAGMDPAVPNVGSRVEADFSLVEDEMRYCPTRLLRAFALLMAGHGRAVCTSMMLGDRDYAMLQLARAHTVNDAELREIAAKLFDYFDDQRPLAPIGLRG